MFVSKRRVRKVIMAMINSHTLDGNIARTPENERDIFMYRCGELNMAYHVLKELKINRQRRKPEWTKQ